jgi:hypothetical protein
MNESALVSRYQRASADDDLDALGSMRHPEWTMSWPQSGEIVQSHADYVQMRLNRPEGAPRVEALASGGAGDAWWTENIIHYADGSRWLAASTLELRDGLVASERVYFGQPFDPPAWRAAWVKRGTPAISEDG